MAFAGLVALALSSAVASVTLAETSINPDATKQPVSTSPVTDERQRPRKSLNEIPSPPPDRPLTRAAARKRTESISPARWLAHYGVVAMERRD